MKLLNYTQSSLILLFLLSSLILTIHGERYEPNWPSLDSRPLPSWYDEAKIGIFMHFVNILNVFVPILKTFEEMFCSHSLPGHTELPFPGQYRQLS